jgi:glycine dehydrogenase
MSESKMLNNSEFITRHIGPNVSEQEEMLAALGYTDMDAFINDVIPASIHLDNPLALHDALGEPLNEAAALAQLRDIASQNRLSKTWIGQGYYNCHTPSVILRNLLENPAWYTAYTPYQPEISQGRLEAVLNFQTMVCDLTGLDIANASLLDEGTAAAEAMALCRRMSKAKGNVFFIDEDCLPQTIDVLKTRANPLGFELLIGKPDDAVNHDCFGILLQYPGAGGAVSDHTDLIATTHESGALVVMAADILSLCLLKSPGAMGADVAVGSTQRFGVPPGFGGPHAAYMSCHENFKRSLPGRLVGVSQDVHGNPAHRLALQTREQHIRREKATSNICTAQVLLAVIAGMYAVYHGPEGLKQIAQRVHNLACKLAAGIKAQGTNVVNTTFFDTLTLETGKQTLAIHGAAREQHINLREIDDNHLGISIDETTTEEDIDILLSLFGSKDSATASLSPIPAMLLREDEILTHPVFNSYHSETEMMRYLRKLADRDIALDRAMIPLGSCTMKLNAASEMLPVTWPAFSSMHPFVPSDQAQGYLLMIDELESMLCTITGYDAISLQPNAGSQGEFSGLLAIRGYHDSRGESHRNICLIPASAHGTNPASAQMCGMQVVVVACDKEGNVDIDDLREKSVANSDNLAAIMITYPSTHGVFEAQVIQVCDIVHEHGGQVYIDGANLNAMVGHVEPGSFGGDVSHLNLHKTFCIPHGGGGPGVGPIGVKSHLTPFLPGHDTLDNKKNAVASAAYGSASILPITWMYLKMMGGAGLKQATEVAILNANYLARKLSTDYPILYSGKNDLVAHECIIDLRPIKESTGISVEDVAKRLIDYGFHAPTMSFPVAGTLMIEPTESESKQEIDRFINAMHCIREEIQAVADGSINAQESPLHNAPHTAASLLSEEWTLPYSRETAAYPMAELKDNKYWPPVGRIDQVYGDRHLVCSCPPITEYED